MPVGVIAVMDKGPRFPFEKCSVSGREEERTKKSVGGYVLVVRCESSGKEERSEEAQET